MTRSSSVTTDNRAARSHENAHSRRSSRSRRRGLQVVFLTSALIVAVVVLIGVSVYSSVRIGILSDDNLVLKQDVFVKDEELNRLKPALAQVQQELAQMIEGRLPDVRELELDQVLPINKGNVKNIVFTIVGSGRHKRYEYRLVIENGTQQKISPDFRILIFNKRGIQVGMKRVTVDPALAPGESRSFSDAVELFMNDEPAYFQLSTI